MSNDDHRHNVYDTQTYAGQRQQTDEPCRAPHCPGIGRQQAACAPDVGFKHWLKCCCCGTEWV